MTRVIYNTKGEIVQVYEESEHSHDSLLTAEIASVQVDDIGNYAVDPVKKVVYKKVEPPSVTQFKTVEDLGIKLVNGEYRQEWKVVDKFKDGGHGKTKKEQEDKYLAALEKEKYDDIRLGCSGYISGMIQGLIGEYTNETGFIALDMVMCLIISREETHEHYGFCKALLDWVMDAHDTAKLIIDQAEAGEVLISTVADVVKLLPDFKFNKE